VKASIFMSMVLVTGLMASGCEVREVKAKPVYISVDKGGAITISGRPQGYQPAKSDAAYSDAGSAADSSSPRSGQ
jgi:hypothetical protein